MIPKSGIHFSEKDHAQASMIPKSGNHFSEKDHAQARRWSGMTIRRQIVLLRAAGGTAPAPIARLPVSPGLGFTFLPWLSIK
jgi:hypothetical protein